MTDPRYKEIHDSLLDIAKTLNDSAKALRKFAETLHAYDKDQTRFESEG